jgi:hypothetical protein
MSQYVIVVVFVLTLLFILLSLAPLLISAWGPDSPESSPAAGPKTTS